MADIEFYGPNGDAIAYTEDDEHIYTFDGRAIAYLDDGSIYSYPGKHLGLFENGVVWDNAGRTALFTKASHGGPAKPKRKDPPAKTTTEACPSRAVQQIKPTSILYRTGWSRFAGMPFFEQ